MNKVEEAPRLKPPRRWKLASETLRLRMVVALVAMLGLVSLAALYWGLREDAPVPRRKADFPPPPQIDAALAAAENRLKENTQDIPALVQLGILHFQKGKEFYTDAINELEEARDLGALDSRIFYCLGIMYQETGLYPFAMEEYKRYLRNHSGDKEVRMLLAKLLYQQGQFVEAVSEYERLKFSFPKDALIEENLGLSLWGAKLTDRAMESFNQLKTYGPEQARHAEFYLGQIDYGAGRYESALAHLQASLPQGPPSEKWGVQVPPEKIHAALATVYQKLGAFEDAKRGWELVLGLSPKDAKAQAALKELNRRFPPKKQNKKK